MMLFGSLPELLSFDGVISRSEIWRWLFSEDILYRKDLIEELELLLGCFLVVVWAHFAIEFFDVLESVDEEALERDAVKDFVIVHLNGANCIETLDLRK